MSVAEFIESNLKRAAFTAVSLLCLQNSCAAGLPVATTLNKNRAGCRIACVRDKDCLLMPVELNGHRAMMLFDTGADNITLSLKQAQDLGLSLPAGAETGAIRGIGTQNLLTLKGSADVKVGNIMRPGFPVNMQQESRMFPIIGRNFFEPYSITVDMTSNTIDLSLPDVSLVKKFASVELFKSGNQLLLPVNVNGGSIKMLFDTGADGVAFNQQQAAEAHLSIPTDAVHEVHLGVAGQVRGVGFTVPEIRVGPIVKQIVKVSVIESPGMPYPLMGANFFRGCSYTIDGAHSQLAFNRI